GTNRERRRRVAHERYGVAEGNVDPRHPRALLRGVVHRDRWDGGRRLRELGYEHVSRAVAVEGGHVGGGVEVAHAVEVAGDVNRAHSRDGDSGAFVVADPAHRPGPDVRTVGVELQDVGVAAADDAAGDVRARAGVEVHAEVEFAGRVHVPGA